MSGFSADWLALREPLDAESRAAELTAEFAAAVRRAGAEPLDVVDLGAGTGANLRYLAPFLGGAQRWRLLDDDPALNAAAVERLCDWAAARGARCERRERQTWLLHGAGLDVRVEIATLDIASDALRLADGAVVTASALLDLVSAHWLERLARECRAARAPALFALTYDGRIACRPETPTDALVMRLVNEHQRRDKGFGVALGPDAAAAAARAFGALGYRTRTAPSDWRIGARAAALQAALIDGWVAAAVEVAPEREGELRAWLERRRAESAAGALEITVGHVDLAALP